MSKIIFLFIVSAFLLLPLGELEHPNKLFLEASFCTFLIGTFGISHGAIDNYLYGFKSHRENYLFITVYVTAAVLFSLLWIVNSNFAFVLFVLISAYHFGQSQFIEFSDKILLLDRVLYLIWGLWLLSGYVYLNQETLTTSYLTSGIELSIFLFILDASDLSFLLTTGILLVLLFVNLRFGRMSSQQVFLEFYQLFAIAVVFRLSSPLLGFTLYFVILHSIRVLGHEYRFLRSKEPAMGLIRFIRLLIPFTLISITGLLVFLLFIRLFDVRLSLPLIAIIFVSCLTFPHAYVMDVFYKRMKAVR